MEDPFGHAIAYSVWQVDCQSCGLVLSYGEDISTVPNNCEDCGAEIEVQ